MGIKLAGTLTCSGVDAETVRNALPEHIRLSRLETGCLSFEITETSPGVFEVAEEFADLAALEAHQMRTRASDWWALTSHIPRDISVQNDT